MATSVTAQQCAAVPFRLEDLPGTAHPAGMIFTFTTERKRVDYQPLIAVYAIEGDMQDIFFFTNNGLLYNFDGLTTDGRYYVNVRVPDRPADYTQRGQIIEAYNQEALRRFDQASDADFSPDLAPLDVLVQSLQISAS